MSHITLAGLDPHELAELEQRVKDQLEQRSARYSEVYGGTDVDQGNWYGLAMMQAAEVIALEFKLARGE